MLVGGPILAVGLLIGIAVGVFQAMTQVQDQTVSFVPKILLLLVMIGLCLPWLTYKMLDFARQSFETPMTHWDGNDRGRAQASTSHSNNPKVNNKPVNLLASFRGPQVTPDPAPQNSFAPDSFAPNTIATQLPHQTSSNQTNELPSQLPDATTVEQTVVPSNNPFILPHYRISKAPKNDIGG